MATLLFRRAVTEDVAELSGLLEQLFSIEEDFHSSPELQQQGLNLLLNTSNANVIVAQDDLGITGMITGQILISTAEGGPSLLIEDLYVQHRARGMGVGKRLLEEIGKEKPITVGLVVGPAGMEQLRVLEFRESRNIIYPQC